MLLSVICGAALAFGAEARSDRQFAELKVDSSLKAKQGRKIKQILNPPPTKKEEFTLDEANNPDIADVNRKILTDFLRKYLFAEITAIKSLSNLPENRKKIREEFFMAAGKNKETAAMEFVNGYTSSVMHAICNGVLDATDVNGEQQHVIVIQDSVRDDSNKLRLVRSLDDLAPGDGIFDLAGEQIARNTLGEIAPSDTDFHPAAKFNAMLILGDLNDSQPKRNRPETAIPRKLTQQDLIAYLEAPENLSDVLLVGALTGLQRHARESLDPQTKKRVGKVLLEILKSQRMTARDPAVVIWVRRQAIDTLAQLKPKNEKIFLRVIENANEPVQLRIAAVEAVQKLNLTNLSPGSIDRFAKGLAQLAVDICEEERAAAITPRSSFSPDRIRMRIAALQNILLYGGDDTTKGLLAIAPAADADILTQLADTLKKISVQIQVLSAATDRKQIDGALRENINDLQIFLKTDEDEKASSPQTAENG